MILFFRALTRVFILGFAYFVACVAAVLTLVISIVGWRADYGGFDASTPEEMLALILSSAIGLVSFWHIFAAALPAVTIAALITEAFSWRSVFVHVMAGGGIGLFILNESGLYEGETPPSQELIITLASGFVAGFVYWLIAGRRAGSWRVMPKAALPEA